MLMGNQFTSDIMKHLTFGKIDMKLIGTPRNDILFSDNNKICELKNSSDSPVINKSFYLLRLFVMTEEANEKSNHIWYL